MWNERYNQTDFVYGTEPNVWVAQNADKIRANGRVLCLADGEGRNGVWLAEQGFEVTSVDLSDVGLAKADALAKSRGVSITTVHADLSEWDLGQDWDAIVSIFAHMPPPVRQVLHGRVVDALSPSGVLILEAYRPEQIAGSGRGGPPVAELMMTPQTLRSELMGMDFDVLEEATYTINEGEFHTGEAHVVRLVGHRARG